MLTNAQLQYLKSQGIPVLTINGKSVKGGDEQYAAVLADAQAVTKFKSFVQSEISALTDKRLREAHSKAISPRYKAKHHEALSFKLNGYSGTSDDFQFLKEEAAERAITMAQIADLIIAAANANNASAAAVEKRRIKFNIALLSATTLDQVNDLWRQAEIDIGGM